MVVEVKDDGRGLNAQKLIEKAKSKGVLASNAELSEAEAHQLIFAPGFSTKDQVTDVSGRGVGMDVVKTNVTALQGHIEIDSELGKGTTMRILLPLTLSIIDSVIIRVHENRYAIPLSQINEFYRPEDKDLNKIYDRIEVISIRGETMPVFRLSRLLKQLGNTQEEKPLQQMNALVIRNSSQEAVAIMVDQLVSQQQVVIKQLSAEVRGMKGIMGSAILGDGKPALILDLAELTKHMSRSNLSSSQKPTQKGAQAA